MSPGTGDFQGPLSCLLAAYVFEVDGVMLCLAEKRAAVDLHRLNSIAGIHKMNHVDERLHRIHIDAADHRRFAGIYLGDDKPLELLAAGFDGDGQGPTNAPDPSIQSTLAP